ncbi:MAG: porin, partial [Phyllobacteriaceae bacterium]|nr:porin [Phyllobacteriaceae bacterium]
MNFKLALAAAAVVGLAGTAQAADLAKKAPAAANYVKICDAYGAGYFYIPGSETCLKIGGYVRAEVRTGNSGSYFGATAKLGPINQSQRSGNGVYTRARANINFDARTATEYGLLRSYIEFWLTNSSGDNGTIGTNLRQAFVQFGGLTAGRATSFFDFIEGGYNIGNIEPDSSDQRRNLLGYTQAFGNGITASLAIEDWSTQDDLPALKNYGYGWQHEGVKYPDVVANVNITQAWGRAQVMGALHSVYGTSTTAVGVTSGVNSDKWGYAIGGGVEWCMFLLRPHVVDHRVAGEPEEPGAERQPAI